MATTSTWPPEAGDRVRVGSGKRVWRVDEVYTGPDGGTLVHLLPFEGYTGTTVAIERVELLECRICRCTDHEACAGGCSWAGVDVCSRCSVVSS